ncbi:MAG: UDP-3-O-[3-hydroxymyristoyl] N-acetylglucosamine deacetylase [Planctomycetes bacterium]|nr:UDP-3-O-[3-hydroxymyristoyl] N-acetylglucosamine deacetylase [Planctomycetota bacterium]
MSRKQRTLRTAVEMTGKGLHSGETVKARILPAPAGHGIVFIRTDLPDAPRIPAHIRYYSEKERRSRLAKDGAEVETVEHFLATCRGLSLDNLIVEMNGKEFPGADGSAGPIVALFQQTGYVEQADDALVFKLDEPVYVRDGDATLVALPTNHEALTLQYVASFKDPGLESGTVQLDVTEENFINEIAHARTFCLASEVDALTKAGFGKGATRENTLILGDPDSVQRMPDEAVRHKLLDLLGDLSFLGVDLQAHVIATRSGHRTNAMLVQKLLDRLQEAEGAGLRRESGMDIREIIKMLPHRYPFLMIDRVIEVDGFQRAVGIKNVTINEPYFQGHFPEVPLMPGVLQLEAMAQLAGMLLLRKLEYSGKLAVLWSLDKVKLRGSVTPGDQLRLEVETARIKGETVQVKAKGSVAGRLVCEAVLMFTMIDA